MKSVITCAGKGTRLLPFSKELPKEMAPIFLNSSSKMEVKPLLQLIFENLYNIGIRKYCFVTGKTKRSIQDHFHPDILENSNGKLYEFFKMIEESTLFWTDQLKPKGFGDAVLPSKSFVNNESFMLHAGDVSFLPNHLESLKKLYALKNSDVDVAFLVREVSDPERHGIITSTEMDGEFLKVENIEEKPVKPESNLGVFPVYYFKNSIFEALEKTRPGFGNEIQLTDAIQKLIANGKKVLAIKISSSHVLDVGTPESYYSAINLSHNFSMKRLE